jgi:uncharacterized membrane protein
MWMTARNAVLAISGVSALAMLYVGAYQIRAVEHLKCPLLRHGCEAVADAPFARPFGIPDGFLAAAMYGLLILLALFGRETNWVRYSVRALAVLAVLANVMGVADMTRLGAYCFFCLLTTAMSPFLAWAALVL